MLKCAHQLSLTTKTFAAIAMLFATVTLTVVQSLQSQRVDALSGADFSAGRIADDAIFYNNSSMSPAQIQQFLNSKVPVCDTYHAYSGSANDSGAPYTCLKDYTQNVPSITNSGSDLCMGNIVGGTKTASQIIHEVAQACAINPQVLIVLLQKEQSLITDTWPWDRQYQIATGYGCPDTAPCDAEYYGFFNQVYQAAKAYRRYRANPTNYNYRADRNNTILWNPNSACGSSTVYIENQATAALYIYTPYRPNQPALDNLYGTGDGCSSYGNRNFWRIFNDWFGSTHATNYAWQVTEQYVYTDQSKTVGRSLYNLTPGERVYVGLKVRNNGNAIWTNSGNNPINLGTIRPYDRPSGFYDPTWIGPNRAATMNETSVSPGQTATFEFWIKAPIGNGGNFREYLSLVHEGVSWMPDMGLYYDWSVQKATYSWQMTDQYAYSDQTKTAGKGTSDMLPGDRVYVGFKARNTGNMTWLRDGANPVHVGMLRPLDRASPAYDSTWLGTNRPAKMVETSVAPGQIGTFEFWMNSPANPGVYLEYYGLVAEGIAWMNDPGMNFYMTVGTPTYSWQLTDQYAYTDENKITGKSTTDMVSGDTVYVGFRARNTGNTTWTNSGPNPVNVGITRPLDRLSNFFHGSWLGQNRPARLIESRVAPGQIGTFEFWMRAPSTPGTYLEYFTLLSESKAWFNDPGMNFYMSVRP